MVGWVDQVVSELSRDDFGIAGEVHNVASVILVDLTEV